MVISAHVPAEHHLPYGTTVHEDNRRQFFSPFHFVRLKKLAMNGQAVSGFEYRLCWFHQLFHGESFGNCFRDQKPMPLIALFNDCRRRRLVSGRAEKRKISTGSHDRLPLKTIAISNLFQSTAGYAHFP